MLPPHVNAILARAAARREAEAEAARRATTPDEYPQPDEAADGHDYLLPAYDPWKGE